MVTALWGILSGALGGFLANYVIQYIRELQDRKRFSLLGVSIVEYLIAQLDVGIGILKKIACGKIPDGQLPDSAWSGMDTIPKEVLLRIVSLHQRDQSGCHKGFAPKDILVHCNNYFVYIVHNINARIDKLILDNQNKIQINNDEIKKLSCQYLEDAQKVKQMLHRAQSLLEENSQRWRPR